MKYVTSNHLTKKALLDRTYHIPRIEANCASCILIFLRDCLKHSQRVYFPYYTEEHKFGPMSVNIFVNIVVLGMWCGLSYFIPEYLIQTHLKNQLMINSKIPISRLCNLIFYEHTTIFPFLNTDVVKL